MRTIILFAALSILLFGCEAHVDVRPATGGLFCDCTDVSFTWEATNQKGEPLDNVTILTPGGEVERGANGTYSERLCQSHTYVVKAKNGLVESSPRKLIYEKIDPSRTFRLEYSCGDYVPFIPEEPLIPNDISEVLHVVRICNSYRHRPISVAWDSWSFEIPPGGCVETGGQCDVVDMGKYQSWRITPGPIIAPGILREECNSSGDVAPRSGVIDPGPLYLDVTVVCECP